MATVKTLHAGNTALQTDVWTLEYAEVERVMRLLDCRTGGFWDSTIAKVYRRARRAKAPRLVLWTTGFSTGELSNALCASGATVTRITA